MKPKKHLLTTFSVLLIVALLVDCEATGCRADGDAGAARRHADTSSTDGNACTYRQRGSRRDRPVTTHADHRRYVLPVFQ